MSSEKATGFSKELNEFLAFRDDEDRIEFQAELLHLELMDQVREMMDAHGWNKADLAKRLGTSKSYITQLFTGDKLLNLKMIVKLRKVFDCRLSFSFISEESDSEWADISAHSVQRQNWQYEDKHYTVSQTENGNYEFSYRSA